MGIFIAPAHTPRLSYTAGGKELGEISERILRHGENVDEKLRKAS